MFEVDELFAGEKHRSFNEVQYRYLEKGIRYQGIFDIETSDFNPLGNFIIGYVIHIRDIVTEKVEIYGDHISKNDIGSAVKHDNFDFDRRLLGTLAHNINQCDHLIGHFSSKFDVPYLRTRLLLTDQTDLIPEYGQLRYGDTWRMMKNSIKAPRNTLNNLSTYTNIKNEKNHVDMEHWRRVWFKDSPKWSKSMDYIMDHCYRDVRMTEKALRRIEKFNNIGMAYV